MIVIGFSMLGPAIIFSMLVYAQVRLLCMFTSSLYIARKF